LASEVGLSRRLVDTDFNNFSPRLGFAWRPFGGTKTVIRGGYGMFYQGYLLQPVRQQLGGAFPFTFNETFNSNVNANNPTPPPTLQDPFPTVRSRTNGAGIQNVNGFDPDPPSAYMQNWSFTLERDLGQSQAIEIGYIGTKGTHLQRRYNLNQPIRRLELATGENNQGRLIFPRPIADFNNLNYMSFGSNSTYQALQVSLRRRSRNGLFYRLNYTYSKSIDDSSTAQGGTQAIDPTNFKLERGRSNFDRRHVVTASGRYELPFGNGRRYFGSWKGAKQAVLGGWQLSTTVTAYSGTPFTVTASNVDVQAGEFNRPNRVGSGLLEDSQIIGRRGIDSPWFDLSAFERVPCIGTENFNGVECRPSEFGFEPFGVANSGRNILDEPGRLNTNIRMSKIFRFQETQRLTVSMDAFNALNRVNLNFGGQSGQFDSLTGGFIRTAGQPRVLQASLTYQF